MCKSTRFRRVRPKHGAHQGWHGGPRLTGSEVGGEGSNPHAKAHWECLHTGAVCGSCPRVVLYRAMTSSALPSLTSQATPWFLS